MKKRGGRRAFCRPLGDLHHHRHGAPSQHSDRVVGIQRPPGAAPPPRHRGLRCQCQLRLDSFIPAIDGFPLTDMVVKISRGKRRRVPSLLNQGQKDFYTELIFFDVIDFAANNIPHLFKQPVVARNHSWVMGIALPNKHTFGFGPVNPVW